MKKQGNTILPKVHNSVATNPKNIEVDEIPLFADDMILY